MSARTVTIKCNGNLVADSRSRDYGILDGTFKTGIDDNVPQVQFEIDKAQAGYENCEVGGRLLLYFDDELVFSGRLDEIDTDGKGVRTIIANGDINRFKDVYGSPCSGTDYYQVSTAAAAIVAYENKWLSPISPSPNEFFVVDVAESITSGEGYTDIVFCPSDNSTMFDALKSIKDAYIDGCVHYYCEPTEIEHGIKLKFVKSIVLHVGDYSSSGVIPVTNENGYEELYYLDTNEQVLECGRNITDISVEQRKPEATIEWVTGTDWNGNAVYIKNVTEAAPGGINFLAEDASGYINAVSDALITVKNGGKYNTYGPIHKDIDLGRNVHTSPGAVQYTYLLAVKQYIKDTNATTISVTGIDMHYTDGDEKIDPYKLQRVVSAEHGIDGIYMIDSIEYNLLDQTDTKVNVGDELALITG